MVFTSSLNCKSNFNQVYFRRGAWIVEHRIMRWKWGPYCARIKSKETNRNSFFMLSEQLTGNWKRKTIKTTFLRISRNADFLLNEINWFWKSEQQKGEKFLYVVFIKQTIEFRGHCTIKKDTSLKREIRIVEKSIFLEKQRKTCLSLVFP